MTFIRVCLAVSLLFVLGTAKAFAGEKYAIVIGIGSYPSGLGLDKLYADRDSDALKSALVNLGWKVVLLNTNQGRPPTRGNLLNILGISEGRNGPSYKDFTAEVFGKTLGEHDALLFYYGGHGMMLSDGNNYIVPVDAKAFQRKDLLALAGC